jgi:endonuclease/exonuclease/phosphatase family metal-dependent hydrolase
MFIDIEIFIKRILRIFNPDELMISILNLSRPKKPYEQPGLIMIQIDGLGYTQFMKALENGRMPHLKKMLNTEGYACSRLYSGIPSSTPSVQGELFYGVKSCVPAFSFRDSRTEKILNMFNPSDASAVENRLKTQGEPLLKGGSAYGNVFSGGAAEAHYCVSTLGWSHLFRSAGLLSFMLNILLHLQIFIKFVIGFLYEMIMGIFDFAAFIYSGKDPGDGIKYAFVRAAVAYLLRDLTAIGTRIDIVRGLPVIHLNLAGYDEQAHYMGPESKRAHSLLKGIDKIIGGIWKAAQRSGNRDYEIFVYSDHGQEQTVYYNDENRERFTDAIKSILEKTILSAGLRASVQPGSRYWRSSLLRNRPADEKQSKKKAEHENGFHAMIEATGPVGHIYLPVKISAHEKDMLAQLFIKDAGVPAVMYIGDNGIPVVCNSAGKFILPEQAGKVINGKNPFFDRAAADLANLCSHPDSGALILLGWRENGKSMTFFCERGSHAGPGEEETTAFALLPANALPRPPRLVMDVQDLREAALHAQGRLRYDGIAVLDKNPYKKPEGAVRVVSYNVHGCRGRDGRISPERIARVLAAYNPDIAALQELKANSAVHQAQIIADKLSMMFHYHSPVLLKTGWHGNAILSKYDIRLVHSGGLPRLMRTPLLEPRGALWTEININGNMIQVFNTHLSLLPQENLLQAKALVGNEWAGHPGIKGPVIICGDFNAPLRSRSCRAVGRRFINAHPNVAGSPGIRTFPSMFPFGKIDHVYVNNGIKTTHTIRPAGRLEKKASDHLPLVVDLFL